MNIKTEKMPKETDIFADIAAGSSLIQRDGLKTPALPEVNERSLSLKSSVSDQDFIVRVSRMSTAAELKAALAAERQKMKPFLNDFSPRQVELRKEHVFSECLWRVGAAGDAVDLGAAIKGEGNWEAVSIPHYGPPLGQAFTLYRVEFDAPDALAALPSQFLCFKAVDYICKPYLNGVCLGVHEGIFEPFEYEVTDVLKARGNVLLIYVENDFTMLGQAFAEGEIDGDKVYAATGLGYDDPSNGWHHCPAGMGIWQPFRLEGRSSLVISDLFIRPNENLDRIDVLVEVHNASEEQEIAVSLRFNLWGQNFEEEVCRDFIYHPTTVPQGGFGDLDKELPSESPMRVGGGKNYFRFSLPIDNAKIWHPDHPWLYRAQVDLLDVNEQVLDNASQQFGMRSFKQSETSVPKGKFFLNGEEIRLRGANTMGHLDMCVFRDEMDQLCDDILLARLTNMNFLRLTQHPVQKEVYEYCDRLGMMLQTDLPLFASIRHNQFWECVRQASAMEKLVRSHPSNILVSFINEPMPNGRGRPHRFIDREDMQSFFEMATCAVHRENPDRVIKCVDGDYDPPAKFGMPDNHCYCGWYLGHGIDLGRVHAGHWMPAKEGWHYGCGEFGAEGLDSFEVMDANYPESWGSLALNQVWNPSVITQSQTMNFHYLWYSTPETLAEWIDASQDHQEWVNRIMTDAFRRMDGMNTFAIHLFIDAWPAGWMKAIMDVNRTPKKSWFSYRDSLAPVAVSLRSDRASGFSGEEIPIELWVANDTNQTLEGATLAYQITQNGQLLASGTEEANIVVCAPRSQGNIMVTLPSVDQDDSIQVAAVLINKAGEAIHDTEMEIAVFAVELEEEEKSVCILGDEAIWTPFIESIGLRVCQNEDLKNADALLIVDEETNDTRDAIVKEAVVNGATAVYLSLPLGRYRINDSDIKIAKAGMGPRHFVSCQTKAAIVGGFSKNAFKFWYDESCGYTTPLLTSVIELEDSWETVLESGDGGWGRPWRPVPAAIERSDGKGVWRVCQVSLRNRVLTNPVARKFARRLFGAS
ncbi:glycoside hydrolase family 2 TIM barrel-domain containing protein [Coraliomargarita sp. SDUM461004]|uniref:Glycoside hydrolase family 2 TIM barrel-domain containing protein n=1 Tax=Thalassobacterium sedimentorum TaxID=3041258 RepID=A0ABU1AFK4_9BACT|nr:glycoside hydrolase family 2 TIM barrel-domain containing protein [Coraliomargarita sp. SDUM461004]MDQ8192903.1 glycoside hydrolase family 2 TIM barrel-domain containing protein [Coraliomargarita sp. SDUM461004]